MPVHKHWRMISLETLNTARILPFPMKGASERAANNLSSPLDQASTIAVIMAMDYEWPDMSTVSIQQAFAVGLQHHLAGRLAEAESIYRQILVVAPRHAEALHLLGVIASQIGQNQAAEGLIRQAIAHSPNDSAFHYNLGYALREQGRLDEAIAAYRTAVLLRPDYAEAWNNLGSALKEQNRTGDALTSFRQALLANPSYAEAHNNCGNVLRERGLWDEARAAYSRALSFKPNYAEAYNNLGATLGDMGRFEEAVAAYHRALQLRPNFVEAFFNLGVTATKCGRLEETIAAFGEALRLKPDYAEGHYNLGIAYAMQGRLGAAIASYKRAIELRPDLVQAHNNLGNVLKDYREVDAAIASYQRALSLQPDFPLVLSNLLFTLHCSGDLSASAIFQEHVRWDEAHGRPLEKFIEPHRNEAQPNRRLRIGYVSGDLREHSVTYFLAGLLERHDVEQMEVFCYDAKPEADSTADGLRSVVGHWRTIEGRTDAEAAAMIREDRIDILVDLAGHTAGNRLPLFARKPAPIQVSWLGYCDTTGLRTMDYRFTDAVANPPGMTDDLYTERLVRLPHVFACFRPVKDSPAVGPLPAFARGFVTFGSFHTLAKLNDRLLAAWAEILRRVAHSRLLIVAAGLEEDERRHRLSEFFSRHGIGPERLEMSGRRSLTQYLAGHGEVDLLLDSHPYSGHTVGCHALWMGVPAVTQAGEQYCSRMMASVLTSVGLTSLIAGSTAEYVYKAVQLAADLGQLAQWRATMRDRMKSSPLMDEVGFARDFERACREIWIQWCKSGGANQTQ